MSVGVGGRLAARLGGARDRRAGNPSDATPPFSRPGGSRRVSGGPPPGLEPGTRQVSCLISSPAVHRVTRKLRRSSGAVGTGPVTKRYRRCRPAAGCRLLGWVKRMSEPVRVTLYNDAGCPWGYSANPAFRVLEWRYGAQLEWRLVLIGLTNVAQEYVDRGYTPLRSAEGYARTLPPVRHAPRAEPAGADRRDRSLLSSDRGGALTGAGAGVGGIPGAAVRVLHDHAAPRRGREPRDSAERRGGDRRRSGDRRDRHTGGRGRLPARPGRGTQRRRLAHPAAAQARDHRRPRSVHGSVARVRARRPAPRGRRLADDRGVRRGRREPDPGRRAPRSAGRLARALDRVPGGLATQEVAQLLTRGNDAPDRVEAEASMLRLVADGTATRTPLGDDALWTRADTHESSALRA